MQAIRVYKLRIPLVFPSLNFDLVVLRFRSVVTVARVPKVTSVASSAAWRRRRSQGPVNQTSLTTSPMVTQMMTQMMMMIQMMINSNLYRSFLASIHLTVINEGLL